MVGALATASCTDAPVDKVLSPQDAHHIRPPRFDCSLYGSPISGCQNPSLPNSAQMAMIARAMERASVSSSFNCQLLVSSMNMMKDYTYFVPTIWSMSSGGSTVQAMGDHHYAAPGSQEQIHMAMGYSATYVFSDLRLQNTYAHEAWHSFTTNDAEAQNIADECLPVSGAPPGPPPPT